MNVRFLEAFVWVAKLGSFKAAAEKMHTTQAGISSRIATLEEQFGVREFWLVLPELDQVEVLRMGPTGRFEAPKLLERTDVLESTLLPGFSLALAELFAEGD